MSGTATTPVHQQETVLPQGGKSALGAHISRLDLTGFRNYAALRLDTGPAPVVLTGANGAGKTNLLEALSFFAPGRGIRKAALPDVADRSGRFGCGMGGCRAGHRRSRYDFSGHRA